MVTTPHNRYNAEKPHCAETIPNTKAPMAIPESNNIKNVEVA